MKISIVVLFLICCIFLSSCSHINIGGTGKLGGVRGSGEVSIPVPKK